MTRNIFVIGSGGFAKEVVYLIDDINQAKAQFTFAGFIDTTQETHRSVGKNEYQIIPEDVFLNGDEYADSLIAIGIGNPQVLQKVISKFMASKHAYLFPNLVHPRANAHWHSVRLGAGNIVTANCIFTVDITVGSFNIFNLNTTVGHDTTIGDYNVINPGTNISGGVSIGNRNLLGTNSAILQNLSVADDCVIGGNALLAKDLISNQVAVGVPAKAIKQNLV